MYTLIEMVNEYIGIWGGREGEGRGWASPPLPDQYC